MDTPDAYAAEAVREIPRFLSMFDREPLSPTFGCGDRTWWQWKFTDFPGARFQEGASVLAALYKRDFPGNVWRGSPKVRDLAYASINFWAGIANRDGSHNEAYPGEHSFVATGFTLLAVCECLLRLDEKDEPRFRAALAGVRRSADWLTRHIEDHAIISNHVAGAAAALQDAWLLTGDRRYADRAAALVDVIETHRSPEGWLREYGGADIGYLTQGIYYLAKYHQRGGAGKALDLLRGAFDFIRWFIHPDGTLGGEYASRNTEFYFPAGFEMLAGADQHAASVAAALYPSVAARRLAGLHAMDAWNFIPLLNNYLEASESMRERAHGAELPCDRRENFSKHFPEAGLLVRKTGRYFTIAGLSKGGAMKVFDSEARRLLYSDSGCVGRLSDGSLCSSQVENPNTDIIIDEDTVEIETPFYKIRREPFTPRLFFAFRAVLLALGGSRGAMFALKRALVARLVREAKPLPMTLRRHIGFSAGGIRVVDTINLKADPGLKSLACYDKFCALHMGSSRYFQASELSTPAVQREIDVDALKKAGTITAATAISAGGTE